MAIKCTAMDSAIDKQIAVPLPTNLHYARGALRY